MDHKKRKKWHEVITKEKCCICNKATATRAKEWYVPQIKAKSLTLYHCESCHERNIPKSAIENN